jgi:ribosomal protein S18 acetylase RimI-like enzyme
MPEDSPSPPSGAAQVSIREAQASDVHDLAKLEAEAFNSDRLSRRSIAALAKSRSASLLVACRDGDLLGYALVLFRRGSRSARLYSLAVAPSTGGAGIGGALLRAAEAAASARGADRLALEVRIDNVAAIRLYHGAGYALLGRRENYYSDGAAALRYARDLCDPARSQNPRPAFGRAA